MDARSPRDGRAIEELGHYDPLSRNPETQTVLNADRIRYWLSVGAQPSDKVAAILRRFKVTKPGPGEPWAQPKPPAPVTATEPAAPVAATATATATEAAAEAPAAPTAS
jgi:small subunit ribosomal protein S16